MQQQWHQSVMTRLRNSPGSLCLPARLSREGLSSRRRLRQIARAEIPPELPVAVPGVRQSPQVPGGHLAQREARRTALAIETAIANCLRRLPPSALFDPPEGGRSFSARQRVADFQARTVDLLVSSAEPRLIRLADSLRNRRQLLQDDILAIPGGPAVLPDGLCLTACSADTHLTDDDSELTPQVFNSMLSLTPAASSSSTDVASTAAAAGASAEAPDDGPAGSLSPPPSAVVAVVVVHISLMHRWWCISNTVNTADTEQSTRQPVALGFSRASWAVRWVSRMARPVKEYSRKLAVTVRRRRPAWMVFAGSSHRLSREADEQADQQPQKSSHELAIPIGSRNRWFSRLGLGARILPNTC
uniref:Uncharacterized protein n=1 Tax=Macrostomum lignano TaxID=282301 RepID=A0A1I8F5D6_9PLAT